jgi:SulP family sulfate permease
MPVETIGSRFGGIPQGLPAFALPDFSWETVKLLLTPTLTIALLGAIESLLCARVADQLGGQPRTTPTRSSWPRAWPTSSRRSLAACPPPAPLRAP